MAWPKVLLLFAPLASQTPQHPPPIQTGHDESARQRGIAVWNVSWLKQQYPLHHHRYDLIGISYIEGDRIITQGTAPGRLTHTRAWEFQTNRADVVTVEEGASDPPLRALLIELKAAAPRGRRADDAGRLGPGHRPACLAEQPGRRLAGRGRDVGAQTSTRRRRRRIDFRWDDVAEGRVRPGRHGSRRSEPGGQRARIHLRDQVGDR